MTFVAGSCAGENVSHRFKYDNYSMLSCCFSSLCQIMFVVLLRVGLGESSSANNNHGAISKLAYYLLRK